MEYLARLVLLLGLVSAVGCDEPHVGPDGEQAKEQGRLEAVEELERGVARVKASGEDLQRSFDLSAAQFRETKAKYKEVQKSAKASKQTLQEAMEVFHQAQQRWQYFQTLVEVAALVDANNLEKFRARTGANRVKSLNCDSGMSTGTYRRQLESEGENLAGMDIDHIVPRSLGGADHPANYQVISSSLNRSLGARWDEAKCLGAAGRCAGAVGISRKCGSFRGTGF